MRSRNQITLPQEAVRALNLHEGDAVVIAIGEESAVIRPLRSSYRQALAGIYGDPDEVAAYVSGERAAWD